MTANHNKRFYEKILGNDCSPELKDRSDHQNHRNVAKDRDSGFDITIEEDDEMDLNECCLWFRQRYFTREKLRRRLPFLNWLPVYSLADLKGDVIAGLSVAFTIVPQGLALAGLAGLPAVYGLYTSFMGCFVYALLGSCKDMAVGPTSIMAVIVAPYVMTGGIQYSILLSLLTGCIQLLFGALNLGFIVDFISFPVISSFSSAAAITIAASQLKLLFGMHYSASRFPETMYKFFNNFTSVNIWDTMMGIIALLILIPIQLGKDHRFGSSADNKRSTFYKVVNGVWVMIATARNAVAVLIGALIAGYYYESGVHLFSMTGQISTGLPPFHLPVLSVHTNTTNKDFGQVFSDLGTGVFVVALLGLMESVAVAKAFETKKLDATQEMIAIGVCNIFGCFFGAFPATGSFSRSAVNHNSGVRTPFGGIVTGALVLLSLSTLAPYFQYIPQAVLGVIIITAVIFMLKPMDAVLIWQTNKVDIIPYAVCLTVCLVLGLEFGIVAGIGSSLIILLYQMARPKVYIVSKHTPDGYPFLYVKPDRSVFFPSIEYMKVKINKELPDDPEMFGPICIVLDGEHMFRADSTFALGIKNMILSLEDRKVLTIFFNLRKTVFSAIQGIQPHRFHNGRTEQQVYEMIRFHNKTSEENKTLFRSRSNVETLLTQSTTSYRMNWASQSAEAF